MGFPRPGGRIKAAASNMKRLSVTTRRRTELLPLTPAVEEALAEIFQNSPSLPRAGLCYLFTPHTTAALAINEGADPDVAQDISEQLSRLLPQFGPYHHVEGNADAHVKSVLVGPFLLLPVSGGRLALGRWQSVFFCEFDGPRRREVWMSFLPFPETA